MLAACIIKGNMNEGLLFTLDFFKKRTSVSLGTEFWSLFVCLFFCLFLSQMIFIIDWKYNVFNDKQTNAILKSTADRNEHVQYNEYMNNN